uniref:Uncharacterized protein n=1 Tax=Anguilla anguilla TaxID=7936 RepID=A0A0E9QE86_ANGAN
MSSVTHPPVNEEERVLPAGTVMSSMTSTCQ